MTTAQTQQKTLHELVSEAGFVATFHTLPDGFKRSEWQLQKRGVIARLSLNEKHFDFPFFYGSFNTEDKKPSAADLVWCMGTESSGVLELTFEEWANEYGFNADSISDRSSYAIMKRRAKKWAEFLSDPDLENALLMAGMDY